MDPKENNGEPTFKCSGGEMGANAKNPALTNNHKKERE